MRGNAAAVARNGKRDAAQIGREGGADQVNGGSALAIDPAAIHGIERPGAVERKAAGKTDARFADGDGVESFDGMETQIREARGRFRGGHEKSLAEADGGPHQGKQDSGCEEVVSPISHGGNEHDTNKNRHQSQTQTRRVGLLPGDELQFVGGACRCESGGKPPHSKSGEELQLVKAAGPKA